MWRLLGLLSSPTPSGVYCFTQAKLVGNIQHENHPNAEMAAYNWNIQVFIGRWFYQATYLCPKIYKPYIDYIYILDHTLVYVVFDGILLACNPEFLWFMVDIST
jgi:hypothetical protein